MPIVVPEPPPPSRRSANMRANRRRDSAPEMRVRRALFSQGARYRVDYPIADGKPRPVRADIAFPGARVAVFIDGCFWHGCPEHGRRGGGANDGYWSAKIARNAERDAEQAQRLSDAGWRVLRFWEHEDAEQAAVSVLRAIRATRRGT